ncbi:hypothetical protein [Gloeothece citriformis]|uniref:hypothetical protein n=1 Tax=Gloeothece citriformis TaxID=2546356 RepID=UPI000173D028|nr:hypothetical protein [Gloeothece citriformis]
MSRYLFPQRVSYAPSSQLLKITQNHLKYNFNNFFAIQNPTEDLLFTNLEVETIKSFFPSAQVLAYQTVSKTALKDSQNLL